MSEEPTLNEALAQRGFTTKPHPTPHGQEKAIIKDGKTVFTGDAKQTWAWLKTPESAS